MTYKVGDIVAFRGTADGFDDYLTVLEVFPNRYQEGKIMYLCKRIKNDSVIHLYPGELRRIKINKYKHEKHYYS